MCYDKEIQNERETYLNDTGLCTPKEPCPNRRSFTIAALTAIFLLMGAAIPTPLYGFRVLDFHEKMKGV